jgi:hypothetical protein
MLPCLARSLLLAVVLLGCGSVIPEHEGGTDGAPDQNTDGGVDAEADVRDADGDGGEDGAGGEDGEPDTIVPDVPEPFCGDGIPQSGEECDDGNDANDDGCTTECSYSCHNADDCDDGNECTADDCEAAGAGWLCTVEPRRGEECDDDNECTTGESCDETGGCSGGSSICDCSPTAPCPEDGDPCDGDLVCVSNECVVEPGSVIVCPADAAGDCVHPVCNPETAACEDVPDADGSACNDGQFCTPTDECAEGRCVGAGVRCTRECEICNEDGDACAVDAGWCLIDVVGCVAEGTGRPAHPCQYCNPARPRVWDSRPSGTACGNGLFCDGAEVCNATGACIDAADPCPTGGCTAGCDESGDRCTYVAGGTVCRAAAGTCDLAENCTGSSGACPADRFASSTQICRTGAGTCNPPESCSGSGPACPADVWAPDGTYCEIGPAAGSCQRGTCVVGSGVEVCNHLDDDGDGLTDDGVSCAGYNGVTYCPGETGVTDDGCGVPGTCQDCVCQPALTWAGCGPCSSCPY